MTTTAPETVCRGFEKEDGMGMFDRVGKTLEGIQAQVEESAQATGEVRVPAGRTRCPACGQETVHVAAPGQLRWNTGSGAAGGGDAVFIATSRVVRASPVAALVCVSCGWLEFYVQDPEQLAAIAESWPRLEG